MVRIFIIHYFSSMLSFNNDMRINIYLLISFLLISLSFRILLINLLSLRYFYVSHYFVFDYIRPYFPYFIKTFFKLHYHNFLIFKLID